MPSQVKKAALTKRGKQVKTKGSTPFDPRTNKRKSLVHDFTVVPSAQPVTKKPKTSPLNKKVSFSLSNKGAESDQPIPKSLTSTAKESDENVVETDDGANDSTDSEVAEHSDKDDVEQTVDVEEGDKAESDGPFKDEDDEEGREAEAAALEYDPYLLKDREYHSVHPEHRWTNKQRCFVLCSRGVTSLHRHLMDSIKKLLPQSKSDVKWNKKCSFTDLVEAAEEANCNNIIYLEARRRRNLYIWFSKAPTGPSMKFEVFNIHTMGSTNFTGNHLLYSRPLLVFDPAFEEQEHLKLMRELFLQMWGTPRFHPKSKPFHDHVISFLWLDNKIWVRHYQIFSPKFTPKIDQQSLREVGPRLVLDPIRIFDCPFGGKTLWKNSDYTSPREKFIQKRVGDHVDAVEQYEQKQWTKMKKQKRTLRFVDHKNTLLTLRDKLRYADDSGSD